MSPLPNNVWSLQGLIPGIYTLDVIVDMSSSGILGTYETILVVLEPNQQPLPPTTIINQITIEQNGQCPTNSTLVNGTCQPSPPSGSPPGPGPGPGTNETEPICPEGTTGTPPDCEPIEPPEECPPGTTGTPPDCEPIEGGSPPGECPPGQVGTPPNCETLPDDGEGGGEGRPLPLPPFGGSSDGGDEEPPEDGDEGDTGGGDEGGDEGESGDGENGDEQGGEGGN